MATKKKHNGKEHPAARLNGKRQVYYDRLTELRDQMVDDLQELAGYGLHMDRNAGEELADIGSELWQRDLELGRMTEEGARFQLVQEALQRLDDGSYGICAGCHEEIPEGRLEALPYARYCVNCKSKRETTF